MAPPLFHCDRLHSASLFKRVSLTFTFIQCLSLAFYSVVFFIVLLLRAYTSCLYFVLIHHPFILYLTYLLNLFLLPSKFLSLVTTSLFKRVSLTFTFIQCLSLAFYSAVFFIALLLRAYTSCSSIILSYST